MIDLFLLLWCKIVICRKQNAKCKFIKGCQKKVLRIPCHCFIGCFGNTISFLYCLFQNVFMCNFSSIPGHSVSGTYQKRTQEEGLRQFFRRLFNVVIQLTISYSPSTRQRSTVWKIPFKTIEERKCHQ